MQRRLLKLFLSVPEQGLHTAWAPLDQNCMNIWATRIVLAFCLCAAQERLCSRLKKQLWMADRVKLSHVFSGQITDTTPWASRVTISLETECRNGQAFQSSGQRGALHFSLMSIRRAWDSLNFKVYFTHTWYLPQSAFNFKGLCYINYNIFRFFCGVFCCYCFNST